MRLMGVMAPLTSGQLNMHTAIRAVAVGALIVALVLLAPKSTAFVKRSSSLNQAGNQESSVAKLGDAEAVLAAIGQDSADVAAMTGDQALQAAVLKLPEMVKALGLLTAEYRRKHFVSYQSDYDLFIRDVKSALDEHQVPQRVFNELFSDTNRVAHPSCEGTWAEFGVHTGGTISHAATWRTKYCGDKSPVMYGFDTFTGLPEGWYGDYGLGVFDLGGQLPPVPANVRLVKGLFNETIPLFLKEQDAAAPEGRLANFTFVHLDMDIYGGAVDVLTLLNDRISSGAIVLFDELVNYPAYRDHEMRAFWEWLGRTGRSVEVIGTLGPLPNRADAVELYPAVDLGGPHQSAAFIAL